jgi:MFS family permease
VSKTGRLLLAICLAAAAWSFSFGLGTQLITHWLKTRSASNIVIGLNHSTYYLGIALGSLTVPQLSRRLGRGCAPLGMLLSGLSLALFPWEGGFGGSLALRLFNGLAGALCLVPLETLVSRASLNHQRTRNFSFYAVALTVGAAIGIWAGNHFYRPGDTWAFTLGGLLPIMAGVLLARMLPTVARESETPPNTELLDWGRHFLSYGSAFYQGFLEGGMLAFLSLYLISVGMSRDAAGMLFGVTMVGVIVFQVPVAWLADRAGRMPVLLSCYAIVAGGLVLVPLCEPSVWLVLCLFLLGASSGALYPMALALLGDRLPPAKLARAYAWFLAMECAGSQLGAAIMGQARDWWGEASMFGVGLVALAIVLGLWAMLTLRHKSRNDNVDFTTKRSEAA